MKKTGFTLIELLAVIVILAVIALIVTPVITGIISNARESADRRSAEAYVKAAENFFASTLINDANTSLIGTNVIDKLEISNNVASGTVIIDEDGKVEMAIVIGSRCYKKTSDASIGEITVDEDIDNCTLITYTPERCFEYEVNEDNTATITDFLCGSTGSYNEGNNSYVSNRDGEFNDVYIPPTIDGYNVVTIGQAAFYEKYMDSVTIPEGVVTIQSHAFQYSGINKVSLPNTLFIIERSSFMYTLLTELKIPNGVSIIAETAFSSAKLESVTIPSSVTRILNYAFGSNPNLTSIKIDNVEGAIDGSPWGAEDATITYLRNSVNINIDLSLSDLVAEDTFVSDGTMVTFRSKSIFKSITSVTIDGVLHSGNSYTVPSGTTDINVTAYTYEETSVVTIETTHNYSSNLNDFLTGVNYWSSSDESVTSYTITFDENSETESNVDVLIMGTSIYESPLYNLSGTEMAGQTYTVTGSDLLIIFYSDSINNYYGFKATITKNE